MGLPKKEALDRYNTEYQSAFYNGLVASAETFSTWRPWVWQPTQQEVRETKIVTGELYSLAHQLFGKGRPLTYTNMAFYELALKAQRRGLGFQVDRDEFNEDRAGLYSNAAFELSSGAMEFQWLYAWNLICTSLFDGSNGFVGIDGTTLISDSHPYRDENGEIKFWTNRATAKLSRQAWDQAMEDCEGFRTPQGRTVARPTGIHLVVGPTNKSVARNMFEADRVNGGDSNTIEHPTSWSVNRAFRGEHADKWLIRFTYTDPKVAPLTYREDEAPALRSALDLESVKKNNNAYEWWVEHKWGIGPGRGEAVYGSDGSES
ncbi:MAG: hypothetical protein AAGC55_01060 [Myxococcota bacterium]